MKGTMMKTANGTRRRMSWVVRFNFEGRQHNLYFM